MVVRDAQDIPRRIADLDGQEAYAVLGVRPDADSDEITAAYRREMGREHPDRGGSAWRAQLVNCAFDVLTRHRDDYDQLLDSQPPGTVLDVISVEPDARSLDDPLPSVRRPAWAGWGLLIGAVAVLVVVASVTFDRPAAPVPAPDPETGWTASEVALTVDTPSVGAASSAPTAASASTWAASSAPTAASAATWAASSAGPGRTCGVDRDGSRRCWGDAHTSRPTGP